MPPKGGGFSKSAAAKAAKAEAKEAASAASAKAAEDAYWREAGDGAKSKAAAKKDEQARAKADAAKAKADAKREAEAAEAADLAKMNKANKAVKRSASAGKVTQHALAKAAAADKDAADAAAAARKLAARREVGHDDYAAALDTHDPSAHRAGEGGDVDARSLTEAVAALGLMDGSPGDLDKHPERRAKAAYAAYCERELPVLRQEKPGLKLQQYKDMMWRAWQKEPSNPFVAAAAARAAGGG